MLEITNTHVYNLENAVIACRNAMRLEPPEYTEDEFYQSFERAKKLVKASNNSKDIKCHDNFLTGILVTFDLKYTQYITKQFQRYHWFQYVSSNSMMHRLTKMDADGICNKYVSKTCVEQLDKDIAEYNEIASMETYPADGNPLVFELRNGEVLGAETKADALYYAYMKCISDCPMGAELFVHVSTNYKQLQTIYHQRDGHKLKEDWGAFCKFVENLPFAEELIIGKE